MLFFASLSVITNGIEHAQAKNVNCGNLGCQVFWQDKVIKDSTGETVIYHLFYCVQSHS